jgi:CBS domain-containing protein
MHAPDAPVRNALKGHALAQVPPTASVREAARLMFDRNVGAVAVTESGRLIGIFTERDALHFFVATRRNADLTNVSDVMTPQPRTITPDTTVKAALALMEGGGFRHLPVVEGALVVGVVSQRGLLAGGLGR